MTPSQKCSFSFVSVLLTQVPRDLVAKSGGTAQGPDYKQTCGDDRRDNQNNHAHGYASQAERKSGNA